jgi:hypothetical protein
MADELILMYFVFRRWYETLYIFIFGYCSYFYFGIYSYLETYVFIRLYIGFTFRFILSFEFIIFIYRIINTLCQVDKVTSPTFISYIVEGYLIQERNVVKVFICATATVPTLKFLHWLCPLQIHLCLIFKWYPQKDELDIGISFDEIAKNLLYFMYGETKR